MLHPLTHIGHLAHQREVGVTNVELRGLNREATVGVVKGDLRNTNLTVEISGANERGVQIYAYLRIKLQQNILSPGVITRSGFYVDAFSLGMDGLTIVSPEDISSDRRAERGKSFFRLGIILHIGRDGRRTEVSVYRIVVRQQFSF